MDVCRVEQPGIVEVAGGLDHRSACWLPPDAVGTAPDVVMRRHQALAPVVVMADPDGLDARRVGVSLKAQTTPTAALSASTETLLQLTDVVKHFPIASGGLVRRAREHLRAVDGSASRFAVARQSGWSARQVAASRPRPMHHAAP